MSTITPKLEAEATPASDRRREGRVLVLAPFGRDAAEIGRVLRAAGLDPDSCAGADDLCAKIDEGAATALVAEEALAGATRGRIAERLARQPDWSDFPLVIMVGRGREDDDGWRVLRGFEGTGHLTLLERPLRTATLVTAGRAAVESRRKQYQIRDELAARARAEEELRASEQRLELAQRAGGVGVFDWDLITQRVVWTPDLEAIFGIPRGSFQGDFDGWARHVFPEDACRLAPFFDEWIRSDRSQESWEYRILRPDGQKRWIAARGQLLRDADGRPVRMIGTNLDITERKRAEVALRRSEADTRARAAELQAVMDAVPAFIFVGHDTQCLRLTGNRAACALLGLREGENISPAMPSSESPPHFRAMKDGRELAAPELPVRAAAATGREVHDVELTLVVREGASYDILGDAVPLFDESGNPRGAVGAFVDITERKQVEEALRNLNETLEDEVAARTAVAEQRAESLRRLAAELSEAEHRERKRLAKILHDDLQQLLLGAQMGLQRLERCERDLLRQEVKKLDELLQESMRTSRELTRELSPPVLQSGTLPEVVDWLGDWYGEKHGMTVSIEVDADVPPAPEHLRVFLFHAVRELLLNAIKHSGRMEASIQLAADGGHLTVQVEDSGDGFDPESVELRLRQPDSYGLFNIRERLEALRGRLEIARSASGGACFRLIIPFPDGGADGGPDGGATLRADRPRDAAEVHHSDAEHREGA